MHTEDEKKAPFLFRFCIYRYKYIVKGVFFPKRFGTHIIFSVFNIFHIVRDCESLYGNKKKMVQMGCT